MVNFIQVTDCTDNFLSFFLLLRKCEGTAECDQKHFNGKEFFSTRFAFLTYAPTLPKTKRQLFWIVTLNRSIKHTFTFTQTLVVCCVFFFRLYP